MTTRRIIDPNDPHALGKILRWQEQRRLAHEIAMSSMLEAETAKLVRFVESVGAMTPEEAEAFEDAIGIDQHTVGFLRGLIADPAATLAKVLVFDGGVTRWEWRGKKTHRRHIEKTLARRRFIEPAVSQEYVPCPCGAYRISRRGIEALERYEPRKRNIKEKKP